MALAQGALFEEFKQWADAERVYTQTLNQEPSNQALHEALADLYFQQGKVQQARSVLSAQ